MLKILFPPSFEREEPIMSRFEKMGIPKPPHPLDKYFGDFLIQPLELWELRAQAERYKLTSADIDVAEEWFPKEFVHEILDDEGKHQKNILATDLDTMHKSLRQHPEASYRKIFRALIEFAVDQVLQNIPDDPFRVEMMKAAGLGEGLDPRSESNQAQLRQALVDYLWQKYHQKDM